MRVAGLVGLEQALLDYGDALSGSATKSTRDPSDRRSAPHS